MEDDAYRLCISLTHEINDKPGPQRRPVCEGMSGSIALHRLFLKIGVSYQIVQHILSLWRRRPSLSLADCHAADSRLCDEQERQPFSLCS